MKINMRIIFTTLLCFSLIVSKPIYAISLSYDDNIEISKAYDRPVVDDVSTKYESIESIDMGAFSNWRTGTYSSKTGQYITDESRICLSNYYIASSNVKYIANISDTSYKMIVFLYNKNNQLIKSIELTNGQAVTNDDSVSYIGISIYNNKESIGFDSYKSAFSKGLVAELNNYDKADTKYTNLYDYDLNNFSNWRVGYYNYLTGVYEKKKSRICTKQYLSVDPGDYYKVKVSDATYRVLIREMNTNGKMIASRELLNGKTFTVSKNTKYIGISLYRKDENADINTYQRLFNSGFNISIENLDRDRFKASSINDVIISDFSNWRSGEYYYKSGLYTENSTRICLNNYLKIKSGYTYKVVLKDRKYKMLIRELSADGVFLKNNVLYGGEYFTTTSKTSIIGVGIYRLNDTIHYNDYKNAFLNGLDPDIIEETKEMTQTPTEPSTVVPTKAPTEVPTQEPTVVPTKAPTEVPTQEPTVMPTQAPTEAPTQEPSQTIETPETPGSGNVSSVYGEMVRMIMEGDTSKVDISKYQEKASSITGTLWNKICNEYNLEVNCYYRLKPVVVSSNGIANQIYFNNIDSAGAERIRNAQRKLREYLSMVDSRMSDLDKVVLAHEYIAEHVEYKNENNISHSAGGPLGLGYGVCDGYSDALRVLLHYVGIQTTDATSVSMNHGWTFVKLNGQWYHIDATWDDCIEVQSGRDLHMFLLKNDNEMTNSPQYPHYSWRSYDSSTPTSSDGTYSNWFVHDVDGYMRYYGGMWYYYDKQINSIVKSDIKGNNVTTIIDGRNTGERIKLKEIKNGVLTYTQGNNEYSIHL